MKILYMIFLSLIFLIFVQSNSFGCQISPPSTKKFNAYEYVFIGKVVGYTEPVESKKLRSPASGLIIKPSEIVSTPQIPLKNFEVFPFVLMADCSEDGVDKKQLLKDFPINSEVRVIAVESSVLPKSVNQENFRLEVLADFILSVARNEVKTAAQTFDYSKIKYGKFTYEYEILLLIQFELRKDLRRLEFNRQNDERQKILQRLIYYPNSDDLNFQMLVKNYIDDFEEQVKLIQLRQKFVKENDK